jgi:glycerol-3-phosphate dehydrogenase
LRQRRRGLAPPLGLRLVKGSHIVTPRLSDGDTAYLLQNADRRVVFAIPFDERAMLIGTTDVPYAGDLHDPRVAASEVAYLCDCVNRYFQRTVSPEDVLWRYAGVRALQDDHASQAAAVTRDYALHAEQSAGAVVLSVIGGKLSTYRRLAEAALEALHPAIGGARHRWTHDAPLPGGDVPDGDFEAFEREALRRWSTLPAPLVRRMAHAYGTRMERILGGAASIDALGEPLGADLTAAEVEYLRDVEWSATSADVLWRRSKLGLHVPPGAAERIDRYLESRTRPR